MQYAYTFTIRSHKFCCLKSDSDSVFNKNTRDPTFGIRRRCISCHKLHYEAHPQSSFTKLSSQKDSNVSCAQCSAFSHKRAIVIYCPSSLSETSYPLHGESTVDWEEDARHHSRPATHPHSTDAQA